MFLNLCLTRRENTSFPFAPLHRKVRGHGAGWVVESKNTKLLKTKDFSDRTETKKHLHRQNRSVCSQLETLHLFSSLISILQVLWFEFCDSNLQFIAIFIFWIQATGSVQHRVFNISPAVPTSCVPLCGGEAFSWNKSWSFPVFSSWWNISWQADFTLFFNLDLYFKSLHPSCQKNAQKHAVRTRRLAQGHCGGSRAPGDQTSDTSNYRTVTQTSKTTCSQNTRVMWPSPWHLVSTSRYSTESPKGHGKSFFFVPTE